jgi:hypothetical protein
MFLLSHGVSLAQPGREFVVEFGHIIQPKRVKMIRGENVSTRVKRGCSTGARTKNDQ